MVGVPAVIVVHPFAGVLVFAGIPVITGVPTAEVPTADVPVADIPADLTTLLRASLLLLAALY